MTGGPAAYRRNTAFDMIHARIGVTLLLAALLAAMTGLTAGLFALGLGAVLTASGWVQGAMGTRRRDDLARLGLILVETALVGTALFIANPFDGLPPPPPAMIFFSPALLGLLCLLALNAANARPVLIWGSGGSILLAWYLARAWTLAAPSTLPKGSIHDDDYATALDYLGAVTQPRFFNTDVWTLQMASVAACVAVLGLAAQRLSRLSRRAAQREALRAGLAAHFSGPVVEALLAAGAQGLGGEGALTMLDCDLTGYSAVAAQLSPEAAADLLRAYHGFVERRVFEAGGAVLKYTGDGVSAVFGLAGAPERAAGAALACGRSLVEDWPTAAAALNLPDPPGIAVGVESGPASWGVVGQGRALSLVILGEPVEAAARLQERTRQEKVALLVGPQATRLAGLAGDQA